jgi:hypothetical protein
MMEGNKAIEIALQDLCCVISFEQAWQKLHIATLSYNVLQDCVRLGEAFKDRFLEHNFRVSIIATHGNQLTTSFSSNAKGDTTYCKALTTSIGMSALSGKKIRARRFLAVVLFLP